MFHRPLVPLLLSFAGGIIAAHSLLPPSAAPDLFILAAISLLLFVVFFLPPRLTCFALSLTFFLTGVLLSRPAAESTLLALADTHEKLTLEGIVLESPQTLPGEMARTRVHVSGVIEAGGIRGVSEDIRLTIYDHTPSLEAGEHIRFPARIRPFKNFENPGRYDYVSAMKSKGLSCTAYVSDGRRVVPMGRGDLPFPLNGVEVLRKPLRQLFEQRLSPRNSAIFKALILGERQWITPDIRDLFNRTGLGHILAVSGLHIGLVALISFFIFKTVMLRAYGFTLRVDVRKMAALLTCIPVIGYTLLAGFQISSQRAMIMGLAFLGSFILGREKEVWSTLSLAGLVILFLNPDALFSISFQLSFAAVAGILLLSPFFLKLLPDGQREPVIKAHLLRRIFYYFWGLMAVTVSATLFLLPITALYFHRASLVSVPANMTVVPILAFWVIPSGLLCAVTLPLSTAISAAFLQFGSWGLDLMMSVAAFWADIPWASIRMIIPNLFELSLFYALLLSLFCLKKSRWAKVGLLSVLILIGVDVGYWIHRVNFGKILRVTFLDVGKGNAALVEFPGGKRMLIDGGGFSSGRFDVGEMVVAPFLWRSKILDVDYLVLSHPQSDHMNGLRFIAKHFNPKEFWFSGDVVDTPSFQELLQIVKTGGIQKRMPSASNKDVVINGVKVEILHPPPGVKLSGEPKDGKWLNNRSMVLKISYNGTSFLFPGDLEVAGENQLMVKAGKRLKSHILLAPHHGSNTSSSAAFLEAVHPRLCVVSSGEGNPNFPHEAVLERLEGLGCRVICTARSGAVQVEAGPKTFEVETFVDPSDVR